MAIEHDIAEAVADTIDQAALSLPIAPRLTLGYTPTLEDLETLHCDVFPVGISEFVASRRLAKQEIETAIVLTQRMDTTDPEAARPIGELLRSEILPLFRFQTIATDPAASYYGARHSPYDPAQWIENTVYQSRLTLIHHAYL